MILNYHDSYCFLFEEKHESDSNMWNGLVALSDAEQKSKMERGICRENVKQLMEDVSRAPSPITELYNDKPGWVSSEPTD